MERGDHRVLAIEVKLARRVDDRDVRHLHWLADKLGDDLLDSLVVTTGPAAYRRADGIGVVPAALLGPQRQLNRLRVRTFCRNADAGRLDAGV